VTPIFVTGIGTGVGKTVVAAALVEALNADYWKPVQSGAGDPETTDVSPATDSATVREVVENPRTVVHPEAYCLRAPISPHAAARREGVTIDVSRLVAPATIRPLIVEGAGGVMSPVTADFLVIDLIVRLRAKAVLVSRHYLGSINHTLLSIEAMRSHDVPLLGVVFNGTADPDSENVILARGGVACLGRVEEAGEVSRAFISRQAQRLREQGVGRCLENL
jgi:dethiobiotin synthetase